MKTVKLTVNEGSLDRRLSRDIALKLTSLKLIGSLTSADILYLSDIAKNGILEELDLSSVRLLTQSHIENIFCDSKMLQVLKLPKCDGKIFLSCFNNCVNLKEIEIIVNKDEPYLKNCFNSCPQIKKISLKESYARFGLLYLESSFDMIAEKSCDLYVPDDYQVEYTVARGWYKFNVRKEKFRLKHIFKIISLPKDKKNNVNMINSRKKHIY
ncbi:MAG: leucine-rich repeat protein [Prevotellaceae bacterium]|jgi:hypothetical protein|nr:leucine-rich repeat protein [Prevotellaceae bacterium]